MAVKEQVPVDGAPGRGKRLDLCAAIFHVGLEMSAVIAKIEHAANHAHPGRLTLTAWSPNSVVVQRTIEEQAETIQKIAGSLADYAADLVKLLPKDQEKGEHAPSSAPPSSGAPTALRPPGKQS